MQCEICGKEGVKCTKIILDGSHLAACEQCSAHGKKEPPKASLQQHSKQMHTIFEIEDELASGYGRAIRKARETRGMTVEELAKKVFEKESFLHRIEAESAKPDAALAKKLENALGIKITAEEND